MSFAAMVAAVAILFSPYVLCTEHSLEVPYNLLSRLFLAFRRFDVNRLGIFAQFLMRQEFDNFLRHVADKTRH